MCGSASRSCWTAEMLMLSQSQWPCPSLQMSRSSESSSEDRGHPPRPLTHRMTLPYLWPCSGLATGGPSLLLVRRQGITLHESHHPSNTCTVREGLIAKATRGRKEEGPARAGPASGSSRRGGLRAGFAAGSKVWEAPERHSRSCHSVPNSELIWLLAATAGFWNIPPPGDYDGDVFGALSARHLRQGWKSSWEVGARYTSCCTPWLSSSKASLSSWQ